MEITNRAMFHLFHKKFFLFSLNEMTIENNKKIRLIGRAEAKKIIPIKKKICPKDDRFMLFNFLEIST